MTVFAVEWYKFLVLAANLMHLHWLTGVRDKAVFFANKPDERSCAETFVGWPASSTLRKAAIKKWRLRMCLQIYDPTNTKQNIYIEERGQSTTQSDNFGLCTRATFCRFAEMLTQV